MRRATGPHNPGVSLFPFLAVLICTMGVMMLLLVVCNRPGPGEGGTAEKAADGSATVETDIDTARQMLAWRITQLETARTKTEGDLADRRLRLSAVEEHMRKLREQWQAMERAAKDLEHVEKDKTALGQMTQAEIGRLRQAVDQTRGQVAAAADKARHAEPSFAIIPYDGPNGTQRRPIYIECGPDTVTLQPEGIVLTAKDFSGPDGPGNPLATILRAIRDYLAASQPQGTPPSEPYPLLIVRPDGIAMFYHARQAMSSWASEFGYELIEQDRKLAFPPPLPQLAQTEQVALTDARARFAWYAQTRTARSDTSASRPMYRASLTGGGIVRVDGKGGGGDGIGPGGRGGSGGFDGLVATNDAPPQVVGQTAAYGGGPAFPSGDAGAPAFAGSGRGRPALPPGGNFTTGNPAGPATAAGDPRSATTDPRAAGRGSQPAASDVASAPPGAKPGEPVQSGPGAPPHADSTYDFRRPTPGSSDDGNGIRVAPHIAGPGEYVDSEPVEHEKPKPEDETKKPRSLAETRGRNWSLPQSAKTSVAVSRPVHIQCRGDQMIILPDTGNAQPQSIPFHGRTQDSIDQLVAAVWAHTKGWGIAGRQMYWRPKLVLEMGESGEGRFGELQALMANSGLEVVRK